MDSQNALDSGRARRVRDCEEIEPLGAPPAASPPSERRVAVTSSIVEVADYWCVVVQVTCRSRGRLARGADDEISGQIDFFTVP